jgi:ATP-dependent Lon protease
MGIDLTFQVIKESGELALSWVKTHAYDLCITNTRSQDPLKFPEPIDIHLHLPAGAQRKDGPSAGIAMVCVLSWSSSLVLICCTDLRFRLALDGCLRAT